MTAGRDTRGMERGMERDELEHWLKALTEQQSTMRSDVVERLDGMNARLDRMNGRVGDTEKLVAILMDRSNDERLRVRDERWVRLLWGGGGGALFAGVAELLKSLLAHP